MPSAPEPHRDLGVEGAAPILYTEFFERSPRAANSKGLDSVMPADSMRPVSAAFAPGSTVPVEIHDMKERPLLAIPRGIDFRVARNATKIIDERYVFDAARALAMHMSANGAAYFTWASFQPEARVPRRHPDLVAGIASPADFVLGYQKWNSWHDRWGNLYGWEITTYWWGIRLYLNKNLTNDLLKAMAAGSAAGWVASYIPGLQAAGVAAAIVALSGAVIAANEKCNGVYFTSGIDGILVVSDGGEG
jgi:hypothetical protein